MKEFHLPHRQASYRQKRVAESIRGVIAIELSPNNRPIITDATGEPMPNPGFLTVTHVDVTADLKLATIHVWPLDRSKVELVLPYLRRYGRTLRREVAHQLKLRFTPELHFQLDQTLDAAEHLENMINAQQNHQAE